MADIIIETLQQERDQLSNRVATLEAAIRQHRDFRGDDRCWEDDETLYKILPEGYTPPEREVVVEMSFCEKYIRSRRHPKTTYISPQREIERLLAALRQIEEMTWGGKGESATHMIAQAALNGQIIAL